jgi:hypothetical protein
MHAPFRTPKHANLTPRKTQLRFRKKVRHFAVRLPRVEIRVDGKVWCPTRTTPALSRPDYISGWMAVPLAVKISTTDTNFDVR